MSNVRLILFSIGLSLGFNFPVPVWGEALEGVPSSVVRKLDALNRATNDKGSLVVCKRGAELVYSVSFNGGFSGVEYIYDRKGSLIQEDQWTDEISSGGDESKREKKAIDLKGWTCEPGIGLGRKCVIKVDGKEYSCDKGNIAELKRISE